MKKAVVISCFGWFNARLYYLYYRLQESGYEVKYYISDYQHIEKKRIDKKDSRFEYIHVPEYRNNVSIQRIISHYIFAKKCLKEIEKEKPDLLYILIPPNIVGKSAAYYKRNNPETKLIVDIIDLWPESFPNNLIKKTFVYTYWKNVRDYTLDKADKIIVECEYYKSIIGSHFVDKCSTLRLWKPQENVAEIERIIESSKTDFCTKTISLCYLGSINNIVDLASIHDVLKALRDDGFSIRFHFIGKGSGKDALFDILEGTDCQIIDHGTVYDADIKREILKDCDFGINMMKECVKVGLTVKSVDYLSNALPILSNIKGDTWQLVDMYQIGINYTGDAEKMVEIIKKSKVQNMKRNAFRSYLKFFSREAFEKTFEGLILPFIIESN